MQRKRRPWNWWFRSTRSITKTRKKSIKLRKLPIIKKKIKHKRSAGCATVKRLSTFISKRTLWRGFLNAPWHLCWRIWRRTWSSKQIILSIWRSQPSSSNHAAAPKENRFTITARQRDLLEINVSTASIVEMPSISLSSKKKCAQAS